MNPLDSARVMFVLGTGAPKPDIHSADVLKRTPLTAKSIGSERPERPEGVYLTDLFRRLVIADQIKSKATSVPTK